MKLKSLLALSALAVGVSASAQTIQKPTYVRPSLPTPKTTALDKTGEKAQYLYNVKAQAFLRGANNYMTRATLDDTLGYKFKVVLEDADAQTYSLEDSVLKFSEYRRMFADGTTGIWVDNNNGNNATTWTITENADNTFSIGNTAYAGTVLGSIVSDVPASVSALSSTGCSSIGMYVNLTQPSDEQCSVWAAVSEEDFDAFVAENTEKIKTLRAESDAKNANYSTRLSFYNALVQAMTDYPKADFSEIIAVYNNADATADELTAAQAKIIEVEEAYTLANIDNAALDNPIEITSQIDACDMSKLTEVDSQISGYWTRDFTGTGTVGTIRKNTWSIEGGSDGTNMVTPFIENWNNKGTNLSDFKCHIDTITVKPGAYKITARVRIYNESGAESISGASLYGNFQKKTIVDPTKEVSYDISTGEEGYFTYNSMLGYYAPEASTYAIVGNDGKLTFGIQTESANYNWQASKDWKVYYLGAKDDAILAAHNSDMSISGISEDVPMTQSLKDEINSYVEKYKTSTTAADIMAALDGYNAKANSAEVIENKAAWAAWKAIYDKSVIFSNKGIETPEAYDLADQMAFYDDAVVKYEKSTAEVVEETALLQQKYDDAIGALPVPTVMDIDNPDFAEGKTGWTFTGTGGNIAADSGAKCAEAWNASSFDIYQTVKGAPAGLYDIQVQGFYRYLRGNDAWLAYFNEDGSKKTDVPSYIENSPAMIYLNDATNPMANVFEYSQPREYAEQYWTADNYYVEACADAANPQTTDKCYPNNMADAGNAFDQNQYITEAYGLLTKGEDLRFGLKGSSNQGNDSWAIFTRFKLTYWGEDKEFATKVLNSTTPRLVTDGKVMGTDVAATAKDLKTKGEALVSSSDATGRDMVNALKEIYKSISAIDASVAKFDTLQSKYQELADAKENYKEQCSKVTLASVNDMLAKYAEGFVATDAEATEDIAKIDALLTDVQTPDSTIASDDNPQDWKIKMVNPSFELGNLTGWEYASGTGDTGAKLNSNSTYTVANADGSYVFNTWSSSAPEGGFFLKQTDIKGLPGGYYQLKCIVASDANNEITVSVLNGIASETQTIAGDKGTGEEVTVNFLLQCDQPLDINVTSNTWFKADNFQIIYYGKESKIVNIEDGIAGVTANASLNGVEYYTVNGAKVSKLQKGVNIVRAIGADGKVRVMKVMMK